MTLVLSAVTLALVLLAPVSVRSQQAAVKSLPGEGFPILSIRPYRPSGKLSINCGQRMDPQLLSLEGCTLEQLVAAAYGLKDYELRNAGPAWVSTDSFTLNAHTASPETEEQMMILLRSSLADRFKLVLKKRSEVVPGFELTMAKNGRDLQPAVAGAKCGSISFGKGRLRAGCITIGDFSEALQEFILKDGPLSDHTGIDATRTFQVDLEYSAEPEAGPSIFTALRSISLKLSAKKVKILATVIASAERPQNE